MVIDQLMYYLEAYYHTNQFTEYYTIRPNCFLLLIFSDIIEKVGLNVNMNPEGILLSQYHQSFNLDQLCSESIAAIYKQYF